MYQKPDFAKISLKVKDVFANYTITGCAPNPWDAQLHTVGTGGASVCDDNGEGSTWVSIGFGESCYTTQNP